MDAIELLDGILEPLEDLIALPQQVMELGFGCRQAGMQRGLRRVPPAVWRNLALRCRCVRGNSLQVRGEAGAVEVRKADVGAIVPISLKDRKDHIVIPFIGDCLAHLQRFLVYLQCDFGCSVDEAVERTRDDHGLSPNMPADDARVLRIAWVKRSMSAARRE